MIKLTHPTSIFFVAIAVLLTSFVGRATANSFEDKEFDITVRPFLVKFCVACHGTEESNGDLTLHNVSSEFSDDIELEQWESILKKLESGEMPPEYSNQPEKSTRKNIVRWIEKKLNESTSTDQRQNEIAARRLTNFEYQNTMRDLLGIDLKLIDRLPEDPEKPYRFNNTAEFMKLGPEQINRYLECARAAMASAIVDPGKPVVHQYKKEWSSSGIERGMGLDEVGVWGNRRHSAAWGMPLKSFPDNGEYRIRVKASAILPDGVDEVPLRLVMGFGLNVNSSTLRIHPVGTARLKNNPDDPQVFEFRGRIENHPVQPAKKVRNRVQPPSLVITPQNLYDDGTLNDDRDFGNSRNISMPRAVVHWIEFEAPVTDTWPPHHHTQILFDSPLKQTDKPAYVREVLKRFMDRAYRRPATKNEVNRFVAIYELIVPEMDTFEAAIRETLSLVLISPQFLYHTVEGNSRNNQHELASKLSYFLWGSMPDNRLLQLAQAKKLDDPNEIERQVKRLLADPRSEQFVRNFTLQWLSLEKMKTVPINRELFPRFLYYVPRGERAGTEVPYRPTIRDFMIDETVGFVAELIRTNSSMQNIIDSDFAYLNQPLAAHYGIEGVQGLQFRSVPIKPGQHLGGLLTQGSILIGNGTGTAPHPIYRAVWLREAILGDEVPPPPADVPALSDSAGDSAEKALTIKNLLAKHRQKQSCNVCHSRLDPWGIPFEQYNAIGKFQPLVPKEGIRVAGFNSRKHNNMQGYKDYLDSINTIHVDASSKVPNGPEIDGLQSLKQFLLAFRQDDIAENFIRKLLCYSLGRELNTRDRAGIKQILQSVKSDDYRFQNAIVKICQSELFRKNNATTLTQRKKDGK